MAAGRSLEGAPSLLELRAGGGDIAIRPMAAVGQTRSFGEVGSMSGLPESGQDWAIYEYAT
jgi:hypothetical protein